MGEEEYQEQFRELAADAMELVVHIGLLGSVMPRYPEHVQENFANRISDIRLTLRHQTEEVIQFGEAFDEEPPE